MAGLGAKWRLPALGLALALGLCGCAAPNPGGEVENLLRAPQLSGETGAVQRALADYLNGNPTFKYPASGDFLSPFLFGDWDGDGDTEAAALYTTADTANVSLAVLEAQPDGGWRVTTTAEGLSGEVEAVLTANLRDTDSLQMLVGYGSAQGDLYLVVYLYSGEKLTTVISQSYASLLLTNITGDPDIQDLVLALPSEGENAGVNLQLLTDTEEGFRSNQTISVGQGQITGCAALHTGTDAEGAPYLVVDGWSGATAGSLFSVFVTYNAESGFLNTYRPQGLDDPYTQTLRYDAALTSRDIDGDGDVDIPVEVSDGGTLAEPLDRSLRFLDWQDYVGAWGGTSTFGVYDSLNRFFLPLPSSLRGKVRIRANAAGTGWLLCGERSTTIYCEMRVVAPADTADDDRYQRVATIGSQQLQARVITPYPGLDLQAITEKILLI